ncbi:MAG TPA: alpha/beta hydrolase [Gaiellaceae bacterium]|nr:alpha/beta hydrolase [Gaiellaceae bacterium]
MREFPVFIPAGADRVAAVVTSPDDRPRGLVLLLAGTGRHNAIGSTLAARLSVRLAEEGLATARLDYSGSGDSPGHVSQWNPAEISATTAQARAVLDTAREALDVAPFAEVGTCYGSRIALSLVEDPACVGAVCLAPPILDVGGLGRMSRRVRDRRVGAFIRSNAALRKVVVAPLRRLLGARRPAPRFVGAFAHLDRARLVFLYGGRNAHEDHFSGRARQSIESAVAGLPAEQQSRFELRMVAGGPLTTFDGLPPDEQGEIVDIVVPYVTSFFEGC